MMAGGDNIGGYIPTVCVRYDRHTCCSCYCSVNMRAHTHMV